MSLPDLPLSLLDLQNLVGAAGREAGFSRAGIAPVPAADLHSPETDYLAAWLEGGNAGEMDYLKRRDEAGRLLRSSPRIPFPWVRSVIVCAANYHQAAAQSIDAAEPGRAWIARYAWTGSPSGSPRSDVRPVDAETGGEEGLSASLQPSDYHRILLRRLKALDAVLKGALGSFESRCYVDTGPIVERTYARYAGIGWTGKNTCTINQELGSWLFLGVILTSVDLPPEVPALAAARCGSCTRCIDACPTGALDTPYRMDASLCIAYLTIEKRGTIPEPLRGKMGRQVFGCDICQEVCPWNRKAPVAADPDLAVRSELVNPDLEWLGALDQEQFDRCFRQSPMSRAKLGGLLRNVAIAMGNSGLARYLLRLQEWAEGTDPVLAESAKWAIGMIEHANLVNAEKNSGSLGAGGME